MKYSEFQRWLIEQGAVIIAGNGSHHKVYLGAVDARHILIKNQLSSQIMEQKKSEPGW